MCGVLAPSSYSSDSDSETSDSLPEIPPNLHQNSVDPSVKWLVQKFGGTSVGKFPVKIATDIVSYVAYFLDQELIIETSFHSRNYINEYKVAVVCSARSGSTKALGTTNLLLRAASEALRRPTKSASGHSSGTQIPLSRSMSLFGSCSPPLSPKPRSGSFPPSTSAQPFTTFSCLNGHANASDTVPDFVKTIDLLREQHILAARASVRDPEILKELESEIEQDCDWLRTFLFAAKVGHLVSLSNIRDSTTVPTLYRALVTLSSS